MVGRPLTPIGLATLLVGVSVLPAILLLVLGLWSAAATVNAFRPFRQALLLFPSMFWSWLVIGLPGQHVIIQMVMTGFLIWWGALDSAHGWIGLILLVVSWFGSPLLTKTRRSREAVDAALARHRIARSGDPVPSGEWSLRRRSGDAASRNSRTSPTGPSRAVFSSSMCTETEPARPTARHFSTFTVAVGPSATNENKACPSSTTWRATDGCASPPTTGSARSNVPRPPRRHEGGPRVGPRNGAEYGADVSFVAVAGGSAGGHLAALTGLTENDNR